MNRITLYFQNRKFTIVFAIAVMLLSMVPYYVGYSAQGEDWVFTGFFLAVEDGNSYIAKMMNGAWGEWLFRTPYTARTQDGIVAFLPYILLGKLTTPPAQHLQLVLIYHGYRFLAGLLAIIATGDFIRIYIKEERYRFWALVVASLGGGLGWVLIVGGQKEFLGSFPLDFISPESFGFLSLFSIPHLAMARAFFIWGFVWFLQNKGGVSSGLIWLGLGMLQPMFVVLGWAILGSYLVFYVLWKHWLNQMEPDLPIAQWRQDLKQMALTVLISSPIVIYTGVKFLRDPFLRAWSAQKINPSPHISHYLIAYGVMVPFLIYLFGKRKIKKSRNVIFIMSWILCFPFFVAAPVVSQRRLAEGIWVVMTAASFLVLENMPPLSSRTMRWLLLLSIPTTFLLFAGGLQVVRNPAYPAFRTRKEVETFQYFQKQSLVNVNVISSYQTGNALPAWAPVQVVLGHGPETPNRKQTEADVKQVFSEATGELERREILEDYQVQFVFWGPKEKELGHWNPAQSKLLTEVYYSDKYHVFQVKTK